MAKLGSLFSEDLSVEKYYGQRHRLWSRFDEGIWMTERGWSEVTPEKLSQANASLHSILKKRDCVLDIFCGCGGDTIQLAQVYNKVIAVDSDPEAIKAARKNAEVYNVGDRVLFLCTDYRELKPEEIVVDAIHCSPPWGGELYTGAPSFHIDSLLRLTLGTNFAELFGFLTKFSKNISLFFPRSTLVYSLVPRGFVGDFSICRHYANEKCKGITAVWGDLVDSSSYKAPSAPQYFIKDKITHRREKRTRSS
ncbi:unnamed protein product [Trypanosoma congolense IL3000]|uniref:Trimethylguanosine synthase n=1 Tax=Trypanosoma congolense (strain IL3000) TaxID=1068625 RepID=F9WDH5_TRYCI|nr:unnamed protein product [Trypanosoma congolense IL3000]